MTDGNGPGYVRPLTADGEVTPQAFPTRPVQRGNRNALIAGASAIGVVAAVAVTSVLVWNAIVGSAFASAEVVASDADIVITFDLLQVRDSERVDRLVKAFTVPAAEAGWIDEGDTDAFGTIDSELERELGITLADDVAPWIGRSVTIAVWIDPLGGGFDTNAAGNKVIVSAVVRDRDQAASFVAKLARAAAADLDGTIDTSAMGDGELTKITPGDSFSDPFVIYLEGELMIMAIDAADVAEALDTRDGESVLDDDYYRSIIDQLPSDRLIAVYVATDWMTEALRGPLFADPSFDLAQLEAITGLGGSMSLEDDGLRFDAVYGFEPSTEDTISESFQAGRVDLVDNLPAATLAYFAAMIPDGAIEDGIQSLREIDPFAYDELVDEAQQALGFDPFAEALPGLGREVVFALTNTRTGLMAEASGFDLGLAMGIGVLDREPVADALARIEQVLRDNGIELAVGDDVTSFLFDGSDVVSYALSDDVLAAASAVDLAKSVAFGSESTVTDNERHRQLDADLPGDGLQVFVDIQGMFDVFDFGGSARRVFDPLQAFGGTTELGSDFLSWSGLLTIDY